jgi:hypothetical protein
MGRKSYRTGVSGAQQSKPTAARRYTARATRATATKVDPISEGQYAHVRQELLRIGLLALALFSSLIVLRIVTSALNLLP